MSLYEKLLSTVMVLWAISACGFIVTMFDPGPLYRLFRNALAVTSVLMIGVIITSIWIQ